MLLRSVFVRFYKSFNYDYLRKHNKSVSNRQPWESFEDMWYPHVQILIDQSITAIVGENESGKSCLLTAIKKGVSGDGLEPKDFCRHSEFFTVEEGKHRHAEFGFEWTNVSDKECSAVLEACGADETPTFRNFFLFRTSPGKMDVYFPDGNKLILYKLQPKGIKSISKLLPAVFQLQANVALPESVPIRYLAGSRDDTEKYTNYQRRIDTSFFDTLTEKKPWFENIATVNTNAGPIVELVKQFRWDSGEQFRTTPTALQLAHDLLRKVARVDPGALNNLQNAIVAGDDAYADGLVTDINQRLDTALNFPKVWAQDKDCRLNVSPRDRDLAFTIYDRTGTQYAFDERSSGLRYFLSYYIQYLAHDLLPADRDQVLIMDEPDAYLSNQGQQDLLKVFHAFAFPTMSGRRPVQVVYVTHSPFLLDKNYADRIRVVEKGTGDEGTRVVRDVSRNHYEPLRSAFGAFVAETTFIGNCNLMVEGTSDQILLAGAAQHLRLMSDVPELETLDLNQITIVPTGGADQIPYLAFVALGRDIERPSVIVLLDSDDKGNAAKDVLLNGVGLRGKRRPLLKSEQILQIGDICEGAVTIEDLVPFRLGVAATLGGGTLFVR